MDFGATRGFDEKFTDVYIEVRICIVPWSAALGGLKIFAKFCLSHSCITLCLNPLCVWRGAGQEAREVSVPVSSLPQLSACLLQAAGHLSSDV